MSDALERSYRRWTRWYPASWRAANAEAMLGVLLDAAEGDGRGLSGREKAGMLANGLAARVESVLPARLRDMVASGAMAAAGAFGIAILLIHEWSPLSGTPLARRGWGWDLGYLRVPPSIHLHFGPFITPFVLVGGLWIVALALALCGLEISARVVAAAAGLVALALFVIMRAGGVYWIGLDALSCAFAVALSALAVIGTAARPRRFALLVGAWALAFAAAYLYSATASRYDWLDGHEPITMFWIGPANAVALSMWLDAALLAALVLHLAGRRTAAAAMFVSSLPWAFAWLVRIASSSHWTPELFDILLIVGYAGALIITIGALRQRRAVQDRGDRTDTPTVA